MRTGAAPLANVSLKSVDKRFGNTEALSQVSLEIAHGEFAVFVGPSGCGKSTLLRSIAGLESISAGSIEIDGKDVSSVAPSERDVAMVFQSYALYPHMSVQANMEFGMKVNGIATDERKRRVAEAARVLQLEPYMERKPGQLSGGQRQRVAIGRAIVKDPKVFLFDEPLSNLDAKLRIQMRIELEALHKELGSTMIYVTHDQVEAMTMADKIVVLNQGVVEQMGPPMELYHHPKTRFVADFIGSPGMNFMSVDTRDAGLYLTDVRLCEHPGQHRDSQIQRAPVSTLGIRPEHIRVKAPDAGLINAVVRVKETLGGEAYVYARHESSSTDFIIKTDGEDSIQSGDTVGLEFPLDRQHLFDADDQLVQHIQ
ncbi:MAG: ABC transporter ATP-binding protein [Granulosicoccus sp.]